MFALYSLISASALVLAAPWLAWQALRHGKYRERWWERFGRLPAGLAADHRPTLWLHAVSVGEVLSAVPLVAAFRETHPDWRLVVSTTTATGQAMARQRLSGADGVFYFPLDFRWIVRRVVRHVQPALIVIVETEIWPNLLRVARAERIGLLLVNARISDRSLPRYRAVRRWLAPVLADFDVLCAQSPDTAARLEAIGAPSGRVRVTGSLKFDVAAPPARSVADITPHLVGRPVLLAASTLKGEDEILLDTYARLRQMQPTACLVLAPRHPERFEAVTLLAEAAGWRVARRTGLSTLATGGIDVLVLDTIGELAALCESATVVFVGGSLVPAGGHNILEPARVGRAVVVGPSMSNFAEIAQLFLAAGALVQASDASAAQAEMLALFADAPRRERLGAAALQVLGQHRGAVDRTMQEVERVIETYTTRRLTAGASQ